MARRERSFAESKSRSATTPSSPRAATQSLQGHSSCHPSPPLGTATLGCSLAQLLQGEGDHQAPKSGWKQLGAEGHPGAWGRARHRAEDAARALQEPRAAESRPTAPGRDLLSNTAGSPDRALKLQKKLLQGKYTSALHVLREAKHPMSQARGCSRLCHSHQQSRGAGTGLGGGGSTVKRGQLRPILHGAAAKVSSEPLTRRPGGKPRSRG